MGSPGCGVGRTRRPYRSGESSVAGPLSYRRPLIVSSLPMWAPRRRWRVRTTGPCDSGTSRPRPSSQGLIVMRLVVGSGNRLLAGRAFPHRSRRSRKTLHGLIADRSRPMCPEISLRRGRHPGGDLRSGAFCRPDKG